MAVRVGTLEGMKRWKWLIIVALVGAASYAAYLRWAPWERQAPPYVEGPRLWRTVDRPAEGFAVELPAEAKLSQAAAQNDSGGQEPVQMLTAAPDARTSFAVAWAERPPVERTGDGSPERILQMARDQALARTHSAALSEAATVYDGLPAREFVAQNAGGGVMQTRLILAGGRLYMLMAAYPSLQARREEDVNRFFDSFKLRK
jgi:hypothetical protein